MTDTPKTDKEKMDKKLDDALRDSFPGSDPVSITEPAPAPKTKSDDDGSRPKDKKH